MHWKQIQFKVTYPTFTKYIFEKDEALLKTQGRGAAAEWYTFENKSLEVLYIIQIVLEP